MSFRIHAGVLAVSAVSAVMLALGASPAFAGALWRLGSVTAPTFLALGQPARVIATASNLGDQALEGEGAHPVVITDRLPPGLRVATGVGASAINGRLEAYVRQPESASRLECSIEEPGRREVSCHTTVTTQPVGPFTQLRVTIPVEVLGAAESGEQNTVSISGGEPAEEEGGGGGVFEPAGPLERPITINNQATPFGVEHYELTGEEENGAIDTHAASHPFQLTAALDLNETLVKTGESEPEPSAPALPRNLGFQLPPGLLGDPLAVPACSDVDFSTIGPNDVNACPAETAVGVAVVTLNLPEPLHGVFSEAVPVFNLAPAPGEPARFGFEDDKVPVILDTAVRTDGDYGVTVSVRNATEVGQILSTLVTLWGQPQASAHDASRGWACLHDEEVNGETCHAPQNRSTTPFLTLPTSCTGALWTSMSGEAWNGETAEDEFALQSAPGEALASLAGCGSVPFNPGLALMPVQEDEGASPGQLVSSAATPAGWNVTVSLPAEEDGVGEAAIRSTTLTLPEGIQLSPGAANGLQACSETQIGYEAPAGGFDPLSPGAGEPMRFSDTPAACPDGSKVGSVRISSPDLSQELQGAVYVAEQSNNPFGSLFALYIAAEDPALGITVKLAGQVSLNEETGQVTSSFSETPQVPLAALHLHLFEGARAPLSTPPVCGSYGTLASFTPWSSTTPVVREAAAFQISSGAEGQPCADPQAFAPAVKAGSSDPQAGAFTSFNLTLADPDADQRLAGLSVRLPSGIAAILASVTPCPEPQAAQQECGPESLIGHSLASAGYGPEPFELPGRVYLTGPYEGAPFGIEDVTPAVAGPFNLGSVTVRSKIEVDPHTAQVTITTDPIPLRVKGVPAQIKALQVLVDRPGFQFNPTTCNPLSITTTLTANHGATASITSPFNTRDCTSLPFKPAVSAQTQGHTSKATGASLGLTFKSTRGEAHVAKTILTIPSTLPARLTTIQKACVASVFEADPAGCPEGSVIGTAVVHTPVLKGPVMGPIYLVSHGNAAWPDAELVLQGEGITVILDGQTAIKKGVTTSSFESVPDVPFETVEAMLPEGPHSALTTNLPLKDHYSLCGQHLAIPTQLTGQNGTSVNENVGVGVQGCRAVKAGRSKRVTRRRQLVGALGVCRERHEHSRAERVVCERRARRRWSRGGGQRSRSERGRAGRRGKGAA
jgi:hypothetical protein